MTLHSEAVKEIDLEALRGHTPGPWECCWSGRTGGGDIPPERMHWSVSATEPPTAFSSCPRNVEIASFGTGEVARRNAQATAALPALIAELTARRARDAEVAELVTAANNVNALSMQTDAHKQLRTALRPFHPSGSDAA